MEINPYLNPGELTQHIGAQLLIETVAKMSNLPLIRFLLNSSVTKSTQSSTSAMASISIIASGVYSALISTILSAG